MKRKTKSTRSMSDKAGRATVGFCLWCHKNFYTSEEISMHNGDGAEGCAAFREFLSEQRAVHCPSNWKEKSTVNEKK
jgi:hypothetical protein